MDKKTIGLIAVGAILGVLLGIAMLSPPAWLHEHKVMVSGKAAVGGPFSLIDPTGKQVTDKDFRGRYMLVFFGYTNCPDICPAGLQMITAALGKLGKRADQIAPIFITIDPDRDTKEKLASYIKSFDPRLIALTGSESEIAAVAKAYRVFFQKVPDESDPKRYSLDHSAIFYLMDKDGNLLAPIPYSTDVDQLVNALSNAIA